MWHLHDLGRYGIHASFRVSQGNSQLVAPDFYGDTYNITNRTCIPQYRSARTTHRVSQGALGIGLGSGSGSSHGGVGYKGPIAYGKISHTSERIPSYW